MNNRTIEVIVDTAGHIKIDAVGFQGPDCEQATAFLEEALGAITERKRKPEYMKRSRLKTILRVRR